MEKFEAESINESLTEGIKCLALADELFALKEKDSLRYVDIVVTQSARDISSRLESISTISELLSNEDKQLAFEPGLTVTKGSAKVVGVNLRVWRWYDQRQIDIAFIYGAKNSEGFSEHIEMNIDGTGSVTFGSHVYVNEYAEMGYEGHNHQVSRRPSADDVAQFGNLVVEIVGDEPESVTMNENRQLATLASGAATPAMKAAIERLTKETWPAQAYYLMKRRYADGVSLAELSKSNDPRDEMCVLSEIESLLKAFTTASQS